MAKQEIQIKAGFSFERATDIILDLVGQGFSVTASRKNREWLISAEKGSDVSGG